MPDPEPQALAGAVDALRRVLANLRKTKAPAALLADVARELDALHARLAPYDHPGPYAQGILDMGEGSFIPGARDPAVFFPYSPVVGPHNPIAPPVVFEQRGDELVAEHVFDAPYCGPPTAVHGGIVALVFDELLGCVNVVNDAGGFTGTLTVRYRSLTPVGERIAMRGWIERREGRKTFAKGTMHCGDVLCAEAEGVFIAPSESPLERVRRALAEGA
ncbi:MAG: PaaI family thioesterase [Myxococcota bacterium]